jgi:hypothetical protein
MSHSFWFKIVFIFNFITKIIIFKENENFIQKKCISTELLQKQAIHSHYVAINVTRYHRGNSDSMYL